MDKPYVISGDAKGLVNKWGSENGFLTPDETYFGDMSQQICEAVTDATGARVEFVDFHELQDGIHSILDTTDVPVISQDRAYIDNSHKRISGFIDITRAVDVDLQDIGIHPRPGYSSKLEQLRNMSSKLPVGQPVAVCDDVIFSGDGMVELVEDLNRLNHPVVKIIAGIGIREGIEKLEDAGIEVSCVRTYEDVVDEVCERDFIVGIPMSGRTVIDTQGGHYSAPYLLPHGDPEQWASIDGSHLDAFSRTCINLSKDLYEKIEELSGRRILSASLGRIILGARQDQPIVEVLQEQLDLLKIN